MSCALVVKRDHQCALNVALLSSNMGRMGMCSETT
jgi:hypothetical protein